MTYTKCPTCGQLTPGRERYVEALEKELAELKAGRESCHCGGTGWHGEAWCADCNENGKKLRPKQEEGKILEIKVMVVYSPLDDAIGSKSTLRSKEDASTEAGTDVCDRIIKNVPGGSACSLVIGHKILTSLEAR